MKKPLLLMLMLLVTACNEVEINQIVIKRNAAVSGNLKGSLELGDEKIKFDLVDSEQVINLDTHKISSVYMKIKYKNLLTINDDKFSPEAEISFKGKIKEKKVVVSDGDVEIDDEDLSGVNCKNTMTVTKEDKTLIIDFTKFTSLLSCSGKKLNLYGPNEIGTRDLNPNEDSFFKGNFYSLEDDEKLGREFTEDFLAKNKGSVLDQDHATSEYIQNLMEKIAQVSDMPDLTPKAYVINANIMNAFALPGGYVFVFRGLIDSVQDESELVGVLGHEWAHVTARHGTENMSRSMRSIGAALLVAAAAQGVAAVKDEDKYKVLADIISVAAVGGAYLSILNKGRKAELEADRIGSQYSQRLNFEPWGIAKMFQTFKKNSTSGNATTLEKLTSSHPTHDERIDQVANLSSLFYDQGKVDYVTNTTDFDIAKEELLAIAADTKFGSEITGKAFVEGLGKMIKTEIHSHFKEDN
ncbi:hypothetical protein A9Q84_06765 [Halobacteriovorax marinus]|uniref:Peptidase M48 domain-containing protein n=1 Tax=Halobacteriovorax marinus TaxID=97084 RepID=A0A1Y5FF95_9BACT|nr:hypothetical protein A9Q84_06765 [Halobacteriovorax marinus]